MLSSRLCGRCLRSGAPPDGRRRIAERPGPRRAKVPDEQGTVALARPHDQVLACDGNGRLEEGAVVAEALAAVVVGENDQRVLGQPVTVQRGQDLPHPAVQGLDLDIAALAVLGGVRMAAHSGIRDRDVADAVADFFLTGLCDRSHRPAHEFRSNPGVSAS